MQGLFIFFVFYLLDSQAVFAASFFGFCPNDHSVEPHQTEIEGKSPRLGEELLKPAFEVYQNDQVLKGLNQLTDIDKFCSAHPLVDDVAIFAKMCGRKVYCGTCWGNFCARLFKPAVLLPIVPDKTSLENSAQLDVSVFSKFNTVAIAESLIAWILRTRETENLKWADTSFDYAQFSEIQLGFSEDYLAAIQQKGFLNQHQIARSGGIYDPGRRAEQEDWLLGLKIADGLQPASLNEAARKKSGLAAAYELRPKYAYFNFRKAFEGIGKSAFIDGSYGNIMATLNDAVKIRTTFTAGDSLFIQDEVHRPKTVFYRSQKSLKLNSIYWEAQVWGKLTFKDVKYFLINCFQKKVSEKAVNLIAQAKIPMFMCSRESPWLFGKKGLFCLKTQHCPRQSSVCDTEHNVCVSRLN